MNYVIIALVVVTAIAAIIAAAMVARLKIVSSERDDFKKQLDETNAELRKQKATSESEIARRETVIVQLKDEMSLMEKDLNACNDPGVIRERLHKLLLMPQE